MPEYNMFSQEYLKVIWAHEIALGYTRPSEGCTDYCMLPPDRCTPEGIAAIVNGAPSKKTDSDKKAEPTSGGVNFGIRFDFKNRRIEFYNPSKSKKEPDLQLKPEKTGQVGA